MQAGTDSIRRGTLLLLALAAGCRRESAAPDLPPPEATSAVPDAPAPGRGDFTPPPTLADLDRQVTWVERPVRDAVSLAREQAARQPSDCSVAEALDLANDSPEANARILAALFRPAAVGAPPTVNRVVRHLVADVGSLNPLRAETAADFDVTALTGVGLFGFDHDLEPFADADAVTEWRTSTDGLVDRIVLRDDLTWSDGAAVTARDVAFTWRLVVDPRVPARAFRDGATRLRAVHAYDDRTVVFFHAEPLATNARDIDFPVLPRHRYAPTWERDPTLVTSPEHAALEARPVTGGPYEVAAHTPGREIVLRRRVGWSTVRGRTVREPAPCAEIRFRVVEDPAAALEQLESGELDEAVLTPDQWAAAATFTDHAARVMTPEWRSLQVAWNVRTPPFADRNVRRAIGYSIDHARLFDTLCHGLATPATGPFAPGSWGSARRRAEPPRQELDKAEALLDESGWIDHDGDGIRDRELAGRTVPFEFTLLCGRRPFHVAVCTLVQESLERVGVRCVVHAVEPEEFRGLLHARRFEAALLVLGPGCDPDAAESLWRSDGPLNACGYASAEVDRLFAEGRRERDRQRRAEHYGRIEEILAEDQPCTWLAWRQELRGLSKRIGGELFGLRRPLHWSPGLSSVWKPDLE